MFPGDGLFHVVSFTCDKEAALSTSELKAERPIVTGILTSIFLLIRARSSLAAVILSISLLCTR